MRLGRRDAQFQEFFEAEFPRLYRLAYVLAGTSSDAEDLAQEAMVRTYRAWDRIRDREHPAAYARAVLINHRRSLLRRRRVADARPLVPARPPEVIGEDHLTLWLGVRRLPARQRNAIVLRYYEGLTEAETAAILGCPVGTVKSHVRRGIGSLRKTFADNTAPEERVPE